MLLSVLLRLQKGIRCMLTLVLDVSTGAIKREVKVVNSLVWIVRAGVSRYSLKKKTDQQAPFD